jgi:hypothetical protein
MIVMTTNTAYEDESTPMHTVGPISGEVPSSGTKGGIAASTTRNEEVNDIKEKNQGTEENEKKTGTWAAGTGRHFDPERWLRPDGSFDANAGPSLPFSLGQRGCFGKSLAVSFPHPMCRVVENELMIVNGIKDVLLNPQSSILLRTR